MSPRAVLYHETSIAYLLCWHSIFMLHIFLLRDYSCEVILISLSYSFNYLVILISFFDILHAHLVENMLSCSLKICYFNLKCCLLVRLRQNQCCIYSTSFGIHTLEDKPLSEFAGLTLLQRFQWIKQLKNTVFILCSI